MEARETLKRQIELLQNLINQHKSVHGDAPVTGMTAWYPQPSSSRGRGHSSSLIYPHSSRGRAYAPHVRGSWRKTYSLRNKSPHAPSGHPSASTSYQFTAQSTPHGVPLPTHSTASQSDGSKVAASSSRTVQLKKGGLVNVVPGRKDMDAAGKMAVTVRAYKDEKQQLGSTNRQCETPNRQTQEVQLMAENRRVVLPGKHISASSEPPALVKTTTLTSLQSSSKVQVRPFLSTKTITQTNLAATTVTLATTTAASPSAQSQRSSLHSSSGSQARVGASYLKNSKFTWVKSQNTGAVGPKQISSITLPALKTVAVTQSPVSKASVVIGNSSSSAVSKRSPSKKLPRKLSPTTAAPRTSKYKWVSSTGAQARPSRKSVSPKVSSPAQRSVEKADITKKLKGGSFASPKLKKGSSGPPGSSVSSVYRWKAVGQSTTVSGAAGPAAARCRSAFHWTAEKSTRGMKGGLAVSQISPQRTSLASVSSSPGGFKLRSRMKIIRRPVSSLSSGGSEKGTGLSAVKPSPRGRVHTFSRSPFGVRKTSSRELVSFGRHKLRRLSPTSVKTSPTSSYHRSPVAQRVFRTRYKMVTRPGSGVTHALHYNPALSWRARRIQSARSFLQRRLRAPHDRHLTPVQRMCWIRGSLYHVSANKLSRTKVGNMSINQTGRSSSPQVSHLSLTRHSSTRHLASRAVQRSLAIIRHARQKKQQKQYCMYYNRFGKCNHGTSCPYIHDPDKVAVCTRFLRGTCKQADGTCPFSHKVAKEKMPVCSYFLKGICNNSDCPYSHVYVSRKAEVCQDFVRGYCPEGEKCKKKHMLVCPDFSKSGSCPRGSRCKLQHRQQVKRSATSTITSSPSTKKARTKESSKRPRLPENTGDAPRTPTTGPLALPSFIALSSSPEEAEAPETQPADPSQVKERKLQIKPRL
ncbi:zinc finger CCCH domain-containing protein 3 [Pholidichthys leucotaenia]